jgi:hypothetical protein
MRKKIIIACFIVLTNVAFSQTRYLLGFEQDVLKADYQWDGFGFSHETYGTSYIVKKKGEGKAKLSFPKNYLSGDSIVFYKYDALFCQGKLIETKIAFNQIQGLTWTNYAHNIDFCFRVRDISFLLPLLDEDVSYPYDELRGSEKKSFLEENSKLKKKLPLEKLVHLKFLNIYPDVAGDFKSMKRLSGLPELAYIESTENFTCNDDCGGYSSSSFYFPYSTHEKNQVFINCMDSLSGIKPISYLSSTNLFYLPYNFDEIKIANLNYFPSNVNWDDLLAFDLTSLYTGIKPAYLTQENLTKRVNDLRFFQHALLRQRFNLRYSSIDSINEVYLKKEKQMNVPRIDTLGKSFSIKINEMTTLNVDNGRLNGVIKFWRTKSCCSGPDYNSSMYWLKAGKIEAEITYVDDRWKSYDQPKQNYLKPFCFRNAEFSQKPWFGFIRSDSLYYEFSYTPDFEFIFHSVYYYKKNIRIVNVEYDERRIQEKKLVKTYYTLRQIHLRDKTGNIRIMTGSDPDFKEYSDLLNTLKIDFICH